MKDLGWIRLHYAFPAGFPLDVLDVMRERPNICKYLDMPLQHISDRMLASMRRGTTKAKTEALVATIRERVPGIALRTTLIAGYPGETRKDHAEMLEWVERTRFDRLGIFAYSHEENTRAFALKDDVPAKEKKRRAEAVKLVLVSQFTVEASRSPASVTPRWNGRTEQDSPEVDNEVLVRAAKTALHVGEFARVTVTAASEYDLTAVPV